MVSNKVWCKLVCIDCGAHTGLCWELLGAAGSHWEQLGAETCGAAVRSLVSNWHPAAPSNANDIQTKKKNGPQTEHGRASESGSAGSPAGPRQCPWRQTGETSTNAVNAWMTSGLCLHHAAHTYIQADLQLSGLTQTSSRLKVHTCRTPEPSIISSCTWAGRPAHNDILFRNPESQSRSVRDSPSQWGTASPSGLVRVPHEPDLPRRLIFSSDVTAGC